jgi:hypothetical protein
MSAADEVKALLGKLMPYILQSDVDGLAEQISKLPVEDQDTWLNGCRQAITFSRAVIDKVEGLKRQQGRA